MRANLLKREEVSENICKVKGETDPKKLKGFIFKSVAKDRKRIITFKAIGRACN